MSSSLCGAFCLNGSVVRDVCEKCIWYDWDHDKDTCANRREPICALYLSDLFSPRTPQDS